jgi:carbamate kinase
MQRKNVRVAAHAIAPFATSHQVVLSHGNGPQVGLLALQSTAYDPEAPYPLDVLGAETEGMIGYMLEQELRNLLPEPTPLVTVLTMVEVDGGDPAFGEPTKFVGPTYDEEQALALGQQKGWVFKNDGKYLRRVVPSPKPRQILEIQPIRWLLDHGSMVICAGGGGIPTQRLEGEGSAFVGVEAVIDKDLASELLAREVNADLFVMATDVDGVYADWGQPERRRLDDVTPEELRAMDFATGSMGPKVEAAARFVEATGRRAAIGSLEDIGKIVDGVAGTNVRRKR